MENKIIETRYYLSSLYNRFGEEYKGCLFVYDEEFESHTIKNWKPLAKALGIKFL